MTLHIPYDYECPQCGAAYVPYDDLPCPRCGVLEEKRFVDFVGRVVESVEYNAHTYGKYMPGVWGCFSLADNILMFLFQMFDAFRAKDNGPAFDDFAADYVANSVFEDAEYLRDYMVALACKVHKRMEPLETGDEA